MRIVFPVSRVTKPLRNGWPVIWNVSRLLPITHRGRGLGGGNDWHFRLDGPWLASLADALLARHEIFSRWEEKIAWRAKSRASSREANPWPAKHLSGNVLKHGSSGVTRVGEYPRQLFSIETCCPYQQNCSAPTTLKLKPPNWKCL